MRNNLVNAGSPALIWTWTSARLTSMPKNAGVRSRATPSAEVLRVFIAMVELRPCQGETAFDVILA